MVEYNPNVLKKYANSLYQQAGLIMFCYTGIGVFVGYIVASIFNAATPKRSADDATVILWICIIVCGIVGLIAGYNKGLQMRIRAQEILCQVAIEENTSARMPARY
jgi:hypothetical protein